MTPCNKIKRDILMCAAKEDDLAFLKEMPIKTDEQVEAAYEKLVEAGAHWDFESEFREGDEETNIPADWSRHYECKSVAAKLSDGSWVGWNYWYGGGKHGNPEEIEWMEDAYDLDCKEEEKTLIVRTFTKK